MLQKNLVRYLAVLRAKKWSLPGQKINWRRWFAFYYPIWQCVNRQQSDSTWHVPPCSYPQRKLCTLWRHMVWCTYAIRIIGCYALRKSLDIRAWRLRDEAKTGRKRNTDTVDIQSDQDQNIARFTSLLETGSLPETSKVIKNNHGSLRLTRLTIEEMFKSSR